MLGAIGDRFDHALGTVAALGSPQLARFETVRLVLDDADVHIVHPGHALDLDEPSNTQFSLLALHGPCRGVEVAGARWPLSDASLDPSSTRGMSNETIDQVNISVADGILTVVVP